MFRINVWVKFPLCLCSPGTSHIPKDVHIRFEECYKLSQSEWIWVGMWKCSEKKWDPVQPCTLVFWNRFWPGLENECVGTGDVAQVTEYMLCIYFWHQGLTPWVWFQVLLGVVSVYQVLLGVDPPLPPKKKENEYSVLIYWRHFMSLAFICDKKCVLGTWLLFIPHWPVVKLILLCYFI